MIRSFMFDGVRLQASQNDLSSALWIDLVEPTREEEAVVEQILGHGVPTREEMNEIEISSRLYLEDGGAFMTAILPAHADGDEPHMAPVSFVLSSGRLVTIRYHEPTAFSTFPPRAERTAMHLADAETMLVALLEALVDRLADILERVARDIDGLSRATWPNKLDRAYMDVLRNVSGTILTLT